MGPRLMTSHGLTPNSVSVRLCCVPVCQQRTPQPPYGLWLSAKSVLTASPPLVSVSQAAPQDPWEALHPLRLLLPGENVREAAVTLNWNPQISTWFSVLKRDGEGTIPLFSPTPRPSCPMGTPTARATEERMRPKKPGF